MAPRFAMRAPPSDHAPLGPTLYVVSALLHAPTEQIDVVIAPPSAEFSRLRQVHVELRGDLLSANVRHALANRRTMCLEWVRLLRDLHIGGRGCS